MFGTEGFDIVFINPFTVAHQTVKGIKRASAKMLT